MKTKALTRAGTFVQIASLLASIATFALISGPTQSMRRARADVAHATHAAPLPAMHSAVLASSAPAELEDRRPVLPIPECEWTPRARTQLTRMVLIESSSGRDGPAIAWTMARRWKVLARLRGESFADYVVSTSRPLRRYEEQRAKGLEDYMAISIAGLTEYQAEVVSDGALNHDEVAASLDAWARGAVEDPCGGASFMWASPWFRHSSTPVSCGDTANRFYEFPRRTHDRYAAMLDVEVTSCSPAAAP